MIVTSEETEAVADAIDRFCKQSLGSTFHASATASLTRPIWQELGEIGVLALHPEPGSDENHLVVAALSALGRAGFPGPLAATFLARALLPQAEAEAVAQGTRIVSLGEAPLMPWARIADLFISLDDDNASLVEVGERQPIDTLGGEDWSRVKVVSRIGLGPWRPFIVNYELPLAAYLVGAATRLMEETAAYANERHQFGRAISEFQGVALPLAAASTRVDAARNLLHVAAERLDAATDDAQALCAAARRLASDAACEMANVAHQTFGAIGTIKNGPIFAMSRRFLQWKHQSPRTEVPDAVIALASEGAMQLMTGTASVSQKQDNHGL